MLVGKNIQGWEKQDSWLLEDEEADDSKEEDDHDCPSIKLSKEEKARIRKPWKNTLIIKLLGKSVGFNLFLRKVIEL